MARPPRHGPHDRLAWVTGGEAWQRYRRVRQRRSAMRAEYHRRQKARARRG